MSNCPPHKTPMRQDGDAGERVETDSNDDGSSCTESKTSLKTNKVSSSKVSKPKIPRVNFPWKLHQMLRECEANEEESRIVSWLPNGIVFRVHSKAEFAAKIMPRYFHSNKYKTFQRSMNVWGFQTVMHGPDRGAAHNPLFQKDRAELCHMMRRNNTLPSSFAATYHPDPSTPSMVTAIDEDTKPAAVAEKIKVTTTVSSESSSNFLARASSSVAPPTSFSQPQLDFGTILYAMLDYGSVSGVHWEPDGRSFRIVNGSLHSDLFHEQLRAHNVSKDSNGVYRHSFLVRGHPQLCQHILPGVAPNPRMNVCSSLVSSAFASRTSLSTTNSSSTSPALTPSPVLRNAQASGSMLAALAARKSPSQKYSSDATERLSLNSKTSPLQQFLRLNTRAPLLASTVASTLTTTNAASSPLHQLLLHQRLQQEQLSSMQLSSLHHDSSNQVAQQPEQQQQQQQQQQPIANDAAFFLLAAASILQNFEQAKK